MHGADGKLECVNLSELKQQKAMGKLNQDIFALTFGTQQIPLYAQTHCQRKKETKMQTTSVESLIQWGLGFSIDAH
jgi:hypothetical protein